MRAQPCARVLLAAKGHLVSCPCLDTSGRQTHLLLSDCPHAIYTSVPSCLQGRVTRRLCLRGVSAGVGVYLAVLERVSADAGASPVIGVQVAGGA